jgi:hypothetical protein
MSSPHGLDVPAGNCPAHGITFFYYVILECGALAPVLVIFSIYVLPTKNSKELFFGFWALLEPSFSRHSVILCGSYEGNPLSPPQGETACGEHPLDPLFFRSIIFNLIRDYRNMGDARAAGAEARWAGAPKSD